MMGLRSKLRFRSNRVMLGVMKHIPRTAILVFSLSFPLNYAHASGYIQMPEQTKVFPSYSACRSSLEEAFQANQAEARSETTTKDGVTRNVSFESSASGVKRLGRGHSVYIGRIWYAHATSRPDIAMTETSHSWQQTNMECKGRTLTLRPANGFTLSTFAPAQGAKPN
jgi:hypothetical protein